MSRLLGFVEIGVQGKRLLQSLAGLIVLAELKEGQAQVVKKAGHGGVGIICRLPELPDGYVGLTPLEIDVPKGIDGGEIASRRFRSGLGEREGAVEVAAKAGQEIGEVVFDEKELAAGVDRTVVEFHRAIDFAYGEIEPSQETHTVGRETSLLPLCFHGLDESVPAWPFPLHADELDVLFRWVDRTEAAR